ncbi:MAG TPA: hypothetical protein VF477_10545 [Mycobacterium sp.]
MPARVDALRAFHGIDEDEAFALVVVMQIYDQIHDQVKIIVARDSGDASTVDDVAAHIASRWDWTSAGDGSLALSKPVVIAALGTLADPNIALAVLTDARHRKGYMPHALGVLTDWALGMAPRAAGSALVARPRRSVSRRHRGGGGLPAGL